MAVVFDEPSAPSSGQVVFDDGAPSYAEKTISNIVPDIKQLVKGAGEIASGPAADIASGDIASAIPKLAKEGVKFWENPKENAKAMVRPVAHPIDYFQEHPVQQTLNILGTGAAMDGLIPEAAKPPMGVPELTPEAMPPSLNSSPSAQPAGPIDLAPMRNTPEPAFKGASQVTDPMMPNKVANPAQPPPEVPAPAPNPLQEVKDYISPKVDQAKGVASKAYGKQAAKPGWAQNVADYLQEKSQMMAAQQMGATPLLARQIGHEGMRAIGQYAMDNGIVEPQTGLRGMRAKNTTLLNAAGEKLGAIRKAADAARDPMQPIDVLQQVRQKLDPQYMRMGDGEAPRGVYSGETGGYQKALQEIEDAEASHTGMADVASKLNDAANKANRVNQPHNAFTDVANEVSRLNNERIKQVLGRQKADQYEQALREYGVNKKISQFLNRKEAGEVKRFGPGSATSNLIQKGMDEVGYKAGAKVLNKMSTAVKSNPAIAKSLPSMFKEFINHVEELGD